ncbi:MAG TPA: hypothetical protein VF498_02030, partial [Anaerolineales bacterium]
VRQDGRDDPRAVQGDPPEGGAGARTCRPRRRRPADGKEDSNDPRFYTARASQSLTVGRVDEAIADIERAQKLDTKNSDAFALQSIIAVTQNEKGKALDLGQKAVAADPKSATARIALSYAHHTPNLFY